MKKSMISQVSLLLAVIIAIAIWYIYKLMIRFALHYALSLIAVSSTAPIIMFSIPLHFFIFLRFFFLLLLWRKLSLFTNKEVRYQTPNFILTRIFICIHEFYAPCLSLVWLKRAYEPHCWHFTAVRLLASKQVSFATCQYEKPQWIWRLLPGAHF